MKRSESKRRIETERLVLRKIRRSDAAPIKRYFTEEVTVYMVPAPAKTDREEQNVVKGFIKEWRKKTSYVYAITKKDGGEWLGLVGLHDPETDDPTFGIRKKIESHGNRYGREAIGGMRRLAQSMGIAEVVYPVDRRNISSKKIPLFFGGVFDRFECVMTPKGVILEIEYYKMPIAPELS